jgi:predicted RNA methylase
MKTIDSDVLAELSAAEIDGANVRLVRQIDRKLYLRCADVLESFGGKWNKKAKAHIFDDEPGERIDNAILTRSYERLKDVGQTLGWFPTPAPLVARVIELAQLKAGMSVLEPEAGTGAIADAAAAIVGLPNVLCCEIRPDASDVLREKGYMVREGNFLLTTPPTSYGASGSPADRVLMNPPFSRGLDQAHVAHAWRFVAAGGRLVSIMAGFYRGDEIMPAFQGRQDAKSREVAEFFEERSGEWEPCPEGSFKPAGTTIPTVIVTVDKENA